MSRDPFMWAVKDPTPEQSLARIYDLLSHALGGGTSLYPYQRDDYFRAAQHVAHDALRPPLPADRGGK